MGTSICPQSLDTGLLQVEEVKFNIAFEIQHGTITTGLPPIIKFNHNLTSLRIFYIWARKADAVMNLCGTRAESE
jgi:hypothetical protein